MPEFFNDNHLSDEIKHLRHCLVRYQYHKHVVQDKSLKNLLCWMARQQSEDIQKRCAWKIAYHYPHWEEIRPELGKMADVMREKIEPVVKEAWEKKHGNYQDSGIRTCSDFVQAARKHLG